MSMIDISIVIPVYNSESILEELNKQVEEALRGIRYELILVNDKSRDKSWEKIIALTRVNSRIKGVSLKKNSGQDNAIMAGLGQAVGAYVVVMDDDLQHSPKDILKLYAQCQNGFDICYGLFREKQQTLWKNIGSKINDVLAVHFLKKPQGLYLSPFKIIRADLVNEIIRYKGSFPYLDGIVLSLTTNITQIDLIHYERYDGKGNYSLFKSVSVFLKHVTGYSLYPLRFVTFLGIVAASLSFLLGAYFIIDYLINDVHVEGWITLVLLIVFFNGLILMSLGLIGEYIGRIYLTITSGRQYVIDKVITHENPS
jgi:polyisoprenyl-phosphate glycosyltransferase